MTGKSFTQFLTTPLFIAALILSANVKVQAGDESAISGPEEEFREAVLSSGPSRSAAELKARFIRLAEEFGQTHSSLFSEWLAHATTDPATNASSACAACFDVDNSGNTDITDMLYAVQYLFGGGPPPTDFDCADGDDIQFFTVGDLMLYVDFAFSGGPAPTCPPTQSPPTLPPDPTNTVTQLVSVMPANSSSVSLSFELTNGITAKLVDFPLMIKVDGQIPVLTDALLDPGISSNFDGGVYEIVDTVNAKVLFTAFRLFSPGLSPGSRPLASVTLSLPAVPYDRDIQVAFTTFPPEQDGTDSHHPLLIETNGTAWRPFGAFVVPAASFGLTPSDIAYPAQTTAGTQLDTSLTITNNGGEIMNYVTAIEELTGPSGWLSISGLSGSVPSSSSETGTISLNSGGLVDAPMVADSGGVVNLVGRIIIEGTPPYGTDTVEIDFFVLDSAMEQNVDTLEGTPPTSIAVDHNGNFGSQGESGVSMDFVNAGDCDPTATVYLYDGSPVVGWINGADTNVNYSMFGSGFRSDVGFRPGVGEYNYSSYLYGAYSTGRFLSWDSTIGVEQVWYIPNNFLNDDDNFYVLNQKIWSTTSDTIFGLSAGTAIDWNIPSDVPNANGSLADESRQFLYQYGEESGGGCQPNDDRIGGIGFLEAAINSVPIGYTAHGGLTLNQPSDAEPNSWLTSGGFYEDMSLPGFNLYTPSPDKDQLVNLVSLLTGIQDHMLLPGDTMELTYVISTGQNGIDEVDTWIDNGAAFWAERVKQRPKHVQGFYNIHVTPLEISGQAYGIRIVLQDNMTLSEFAHYRVVDTSGNGDFIPSTVWGAPTIDTDSNGNTEIIISDNTPLVFGEAVYIGFRPLNESRQLIMLDHQWIDDNENNIRDIELQKASFKSTTGSQKMLENDTLVFYRTVCPYTAENSFRFFVANVDIDPDSVLGDISRLAGVSEFFPQDNLLTRYYSWEEQTICGYYQTIVPYDAVIRKVIYVQTTIRAFGTVYQQRYDRFVASSICCFGIRGNINDDFLDNIDVADLTFLVSFMFRAGMTPPCDEEGDIDASGGSPPINVSDLTFLVDYMFRGGDVPPFCPIIE